MTTIINLDTYKTIKGISSTTNDVKLSSIIASVNSFIVSYCNRTFIDFYGTNKTEYFDARYNEIYPSEYPIIAVVSVEVSTDFGTTYTALVNKTDYVLDAENDRIVSLFDQFAYPTIPTNSLKLVYKGGYAKVPEDLQMAAANLVDYFFEEQYQPKKALQGASIENLVYSDKSTSLPAHIRRVLDHYRSQVL